MNNITAVVALTATGILVFYFFYIVYHAFRAWDAYVENKEE